MQRYTILWADDEIDLLKSYRAEDLINVIRARTFPPYPGAYFMHAGKKIYLRLELSEEQQNDESDLAGGPDSDAHSV